MNLSSLIPLFRRAGSLVLPALISSLGGLPALPLVFIVLFWRPRQPLSLGLSAIVRESMGLAPLAIALGSIVAVFQICLWLWSARRRHSRPRIGVSILFTLLTGALLLGLAMAGDGAAGYTHFEHFRIYIPIGLWLLFSAPTIAIVFHSVASRLQRPA